MQSLTIHTRLGKDGILKIEMPVGITETEAEFGRVPGLQMEDWQA